MTSVLGVDGCKGGWVGAQVGPAGISWHIFATAEQVLAHGADALAMDIPIGLAEHGVRRCDVEARRRPHVRASSVFAAPIRVVLGARSYAEARARSEAVDGRSLSAQCYGIVPKIAEVDAGLRAQPGRDVLEVHPEVSFACLAGRPLARKKSAAGALARMQLLVGALGALPEDVPAQAGLDDALDALVCAWTASRWLRGQAEVLGGELDATGQVMRIVI